VFPSESKKNGIHPKWLKCRDLHESVPYREMSKDATVPRDLATGEILYISRPEGTKGQ
jgi:hypothetical protein